MENQENLRNRHTVADKDKAANAPKPSGISEMPAQTTNMQNGVDYTSNWGFPQQSSSSHPVQYKTANEYSKAVQQWLWQYQMWNQMNWFYMTFPFYAMSCMSQNPMVGPQLNSSQWPPSGSGSIPQVPDRPQAVQAQRNARPVVTEFNIPPLWRRVVAEFIDFFILFVVKLAVTIMTVEYVGIVDLEKYDIENLMSQNLDYNAAFAMTSELVAMEIINRIFICIYETLCLRRGIAGMVGGTTPGKRMMGLKVVSCDDVVTLGANRVRIIPAGDIGFCNALVRSVIKNFSLAFFFPVCFTVFFFQHNRAAYDVIASCIVVETTEEELRLHRPRR